MTADSAIDLATAEDPRDAVLRAVAAVSQDRTVRLPLECGPDCVRLATSAPPQIPEGVAGSTEPVGLLFDHTAAAADFLPQLSPAEARMVLRSWPGEVVFEVPIDPDGPLPQLAEWVRAAAADDTHLRLRVDGRPATADVASLAAAPMVFGPAALLGEPELTLADSEFPGLVAATVVRLTADGGWSVVREGAVSEADLKQRLGVQVVFVCTGNTCRSPMAEVAFRRMLAEALDTDEAGLGERGVRVLSAGIAAPPGSPASTHSADAVKRDALDLSGHRSRQATVDMLSASDAVFTMTQGHRASILSSIPDLAPAVQVLNPDGRDVADPIGGSAAQYRDCYDEIAAALRARLPAVLQLIEESQTPDA